MKTRWWWILTVVFTIISSLLSLSRGVYNKTNQSLSFCDSVQLCKSLGGGLPLKENLISLQKFMTSFTPPNNINATWMLIDELAVGDALSHCGTTPTTTACPGLVALAVDTTVLRPPLANCRHSSVDLAICGPPAADLSDRSFPMSEPNAKRSGSFCNAQERCKRSGFDITGPYDKLGLAIVQKILSAFERSGAWSLSHAADSNWNFFCSNGKIDCPGEIILHELTSVVKGSLIGCDVTLPVICDLPDNTEFVPALPNPKSPTSTAPTTDVTSSNSVDEADGSQIEDGGSKNQTNDNLVLILGVVAGLLVLLVIIIFVIFVLVRKKKSRNAKGDSQSKTHVTEAHNPTYRLETNDIITGYSDNDYAIIDDVVDPPSPRSDLPLPSAPPPIGADPGYTEIMDQMCGDGNYLGTYEDIDGLKIYPKGVQTTNRTELTSDSGDNTNTENKYLVLIPGIDGEGPVGIGSTPTAAGSVDVSEHLGESKSRDAPTCVVDVSKGLSDSESNHLPTEMPIYAVPIKFTPSDDIDPDEVTLVENSLYG